jgi:hypothetical protein
VGNSILWSQTMRAIVLVALLAQAPAGGENLLDDPAVRLGLGLADGQTELTASQARRYAQIQLQQKGLTGLNAPETIRRVNLSLHQRKMISGFMLRAIEENDDHMKIATVSASIGLDQEGIRNTLEAEMRASFAKAERASWGLLTQPQRDMFLWMVGPPVAGRPSWVDPFRPAAQGSRSRTP